MQTKTTILLLLISSLFITCNKNSDDNNNASLKVTVVNNGVVVPSATVKIYTFSPQTQVGVAQTTVADGTVTFTGLTTIPYFIEAKKGCMSSELGFVFGSYPLFANTLNLRTTEIDSIGYLKLTNDTTVNYIVSGFGSAAVLEAGVTYISTRFTKPYTITGYPQNNPGATRDTLININCTDTVRLNYPFY